jgi:hypothetical protein
MIVYCFRLVARSDTGIVDGLKSYMLIFTRLSRIAGKFKLESDEVPHAGLLLEGKEQGE